MPRICKTTPRGPDGRPLIVRDDRSAEEFLTRFFELRPVIPEGSSFGRFLTVNGYSSCRTVEEQPNQGLLKSALADVYVLGQRAAAGDNEALRAMTIIQSLLEKKRPASYHTQIAVA